MDDAAADPTVIRRIDRVRVAFEQDGGLPRRGLARTSYSLGCAGSNIGRSNRLEHRFTVGQIVELTPSTLRAAALGEYEIKQTMPVSDISSHSPRYRIKSLAENHDRIVAESELELVGEKETHQALGFMNLPTLEA
jgi:hypothetical protein